MSLLTAAERRFAQAVSHLAHCNPFLPERIEYEREALGHDFVPAGDVWHIRENAPDETPNIALLQRRVEAFVQDLHGRLGRGRTATAEELSLYRDLVTYAIYYRFQTDLMALVSRGSEAGVGKSGRVLFYKKLRAELGELLDVPGLGGAAAGAAEAPHLLACLYQVRRAFHQIFRFIVGGSMATARLRASVWQSVFTHDMRRYRRSLYDWMSDIAVLITGPSGTGKELVARAVAFSQYIPFDPESERFHSVPDQQLFALNLSALSPTLIESELFGHRRGAFTSALEDHVGWLEACGPYGTVFLDEIGDIDMGIQVKLLRALETRAFQRLGETEPRRFEGKLIAATNRDLADAMRKGHFREDLYYRMCSDMIVTPSLRERIETCPGELRSLLFFLSRRLVGEQEAGPLTEEVEDWIERSLGREYHWPGNVRELEQCIRNVLIRKEYRPTQERKANASEDWLRAVREGALTAEEVMRRYCTTVYARTRSFQETSRRLDLDRRTVKSKVDQAFLAELDAGRWEGQ